MKNYAVALFLTAATGIIGLLVASPAPAQTTRPTIQIQRGGKTIQIDLPFCADFCGYSGNFENRSEIDTRGFEGMVIGKDGDYFLQETLKKAVLGEGQHCLEIATVRFSDGSLAFISNTSFWWERVHSRIAEIFGDEQLTAERLASVILTANRTQEEEATGVFAFHRSYYWNFSVPFREGQKELARRVWKANFFRTQNSFALPPVSNVEKSNWAALTPALRGGCIEADDAASRYLALELKDTGLNSGPVHVSMPSITSGMIYFHLRPDLSNALSIAGVLSAQAYTERDGFGRVTGSVILAKEKFLTNYVRSYFHGELCKEK